MARVILTGASGFIGSRVLQRLIEGGHEVHVLGRQSPADNAIWYQPVDLLERIPDLTAISATHLVHCAWYAEHGRFWEAPENCDWVAASLRLARAFAAAGGRRIVIAGTCAEYGWDRPIYSEEMTCPPPQTLYGQAKRSLFELLSAAAPVLGLSLGWGRIFIPYGSREDSRRLLGTLIAARTAGHEAEFSTGEQVRDFIHVDDVAGALIALLDSDVEGAVNIGSGIGTRVRDFITEAATIAGYADHVRLGARPMRPGDPISLVANTTRLNDLVGFKPRYTLSTGLAEALSNG